MILSATGKSRERRIRDAEPLYLKASAAMDYDKRQEQLEAFADIVEVLDSGDYDGMFAEAPTGSGKTFLLALAAYYAVKQRRQKVLIATPRKDLQEDFCAEISRMAKGLHSRLNIAVLKGRANYLSRNRALWIYENAGTEPRVRNAALQILNSAELCGGDLEKIFADPKVMAAVNELSEAERDMYFSASALALPQSRSSNGGEDLDEETDSEIDTDSSFYEIACEKARDADVVISNHSMLAARMLVYARHADETSVSLLSRVVIIDEGHRFADAVMNYLSSKMSVFRMTAHLRLMLSSFKGSAHERKLSAAISSVQGFEQALQHIVSKHPRSYLHVRASAGRKEREDIQEVLRLSEGAVEAINAILKKIPRRQISERCLLPHTVVQSEVAMLRNFCKTAQDALLGKGFAHFVATTSPREKRVSFERTVTSASNMISRNLWGVAPKVIVMSGTLVDGTASSNNMPSFNFQIGEYGAANKNLFLRAYPPPFTWDVDAFVDEQAPIIEFSDDDSPREEEAKRDQWAQYIAAKLVSIAKHATGGVVVLTPANKDIELIEKHYALFTDGQRKRRRVIAQMRGVTLWQAQQEFREIAGNAILITAAGWEGIDLPGELLTDLVITRLPLAPPSSPRQIAMQKQRGARSAFIYTLSSAFIQFRQGVGRLCRRIGDRGNIYVLDPKIEHPSFRAFKEFLSSRCRLNKCA